ncbi:MAG: hypothetical protein ACJA08_000704 [Cyclobacteriaceae bacterium]|jgi:hypothetical protein
MKIFFKAYFFLLTLVLPIFVQAQCAMCRTQIVNNVSQGDTTLAAGLNAGIIYLFIMPYISIGVIAYLWFRNSKVNERKRTFTSNTSM